MNLSGIVHHKELSYKCIKDKQAAMDIQGIISAQQLSSDSRASVETQRKKEEMAISFEEIFARKLVQEMTKDSFSFDDNNNMAGQANGLYRSHIINTLARKLAEEHKLGIGELMMEKMK